MRQLCALDSLEVFEFNGGREVPLSQRVRIVTGLTFIKRFSLLLALAAISIGCEDGRSLGGAQGLSTEPTTWLGNPGTAVTIRFATGTERLKGAHEVHFKSGRSKGEFWEVADFTVPVMKLEPRAVTLFFSNDEEHSFVLSHVSEEIGSRTLRVVPCYSATVCG